MIECCGKPLGEPTVIWTGIKRSQEGRAAAGKRSCFLARMCGECAKLYPGPDPMKPEHQRFIDNRNRMLGLL